MKHLVSILIFLVCVLSAGAEEWDRVGTWKDLGMTMFKNDLVTVQYDSSNVMFPGIGRPGPSIDFIVLAIYPTVMNGAVGKDGVIQFKPSQDYCYMHVSAVATEAAVTFHVLRYKGADPLNPGYDGRELLQYQDGQAMLARLKDRSQLEPVWQKLRPVVRSYVQAEQ